MITSNRLEKGIIELLLRLPHKICNRNVTKIIQNVVINYLQRITYEPTCASGPTRVAGAFVGKERTSQVDNRSLST